MCSALQEMFGMGGDAGPVDEPELDPAVVERNKTVTKPKDLNIGSGLAGGAQLDIAGHPDRLKRQMEEAGL